MTSDFCDNATAPHTIHSGDQNLRKIHNGFHRRHSLKSANGDAPSPITNGKYTTTNGKFLTPLLTSADETTSKSERAIDDETLSTENLRLEYVIDPAARSSSASTGAQAAQKSGGLLDQLRSTQLVYWTMTLSFIINYFWNRRHNLRAFFAAWAMLAAAAFFAVLFFATVVFSYLLYDLPRKMSSSSSSQEAVSSASSYCSLRGENSPLSSRRSSTILTSPPPPRLSASSDDNDSNNSNCSTFYSCNRKSVADHRKSAAAHFWQGNVSTGVVYYGKSFKSI